MLVFKFFVTRCVVSRCFQCGAVLHSSLRVAPADASQVFQVPGGVGRNIAEAAHHVLCSWNAVHSDGAHRRSARAGDEGGSNRGSVLLISPLGQDAAGDALIADFEQHGCAS